jgi:hypothetical protein
VNKGIQPGRGGGGGGEGNERQIKMNDIKVTLYIYFFPLFIV